MSTIGARIMNDLHRHTNPHMHSSMYMGPSASSVELAVAAKSVEANPHTLVALSRNRRPYLDVPCVLGRWRCVIKVWNVSHTHPESYPPISDHVQLCACTCVCACARARLHVCKSLSRESANDSATRRKA